MIRRYLARRLPDYPLTPLSQSKAGPSSRPFSASSSSSSVPPSGSDTPRPKPRRKKADPWSTPSSSSSPFRDLDPLDPPRPPRRKRESTPIRLRAGLLSENKAWDTGRALGEALAMRARVVGTLDGSEASAASAASAASVPVSAPAAVAAVSAPAVSPASAAPSASPASPASPASTEDRPRKRDYGLKAEYASRSYVDSAAAAAAAFGASAVPVTSASATAPDSPFPSDTGSASGSGSGSAPATSFGLKSAAGFGTNTNDPMRRSPLIADVPGARPGGPGGGGESFTAKYGSILDTWGREWRKVDLTCPPRAVNKIPIKHEQYDSVVALRDAQTYKGRFFLARLKPGRLQRSGPFTDMQRMYRGKLGLVLEAQKRHRAATAAVVSGSASSALEGVSEGVSEVSPEVSPEVVGLTPEGSRLASASSASSVSAAGGVAGPETMAGLDLPPPRAPSEPSISLTIVANKLRVSKLAVERRHAINRLRAAWTHVISHSPVAPVSTEHCYFLHVADGRVYDAVPFWELCEEAERAITSLARAIVAREMGGERRRSTGGGGYRRAGGEGRNAERRDLAKKKQIWRGTGVH
ncbi:hypothetical protein A1Q1_00220 [Trichosporon asahii var. asahii CBS 2479]|uniref:Uncharacterized protein n=1 Tax=Trichosporon asahii var. asahii (strain ATCC 90039 / CBS 2479 / JCM 2466 / KCTC 7840 / NBRC 103889/ NCYC 2677 / UAMH 7654) TaxID=1186058 RepID=J6F0N5_TRIAS|nr:hypothetical protein A1Q1_00220 [Trichosporon asahii var. asahii CBS 2479]EJT50479.1 hypothetical protein A1Q1_00220 [Trichosporon asahii var. asahii CBS 2479]